MVAGHRVSWDVALDHVASHFARIIEQNGPDSVAFYLSGQLLTEDYYIANKLMKGFIGSANVDTNSRLCMSSTVAAHRYVFGSDSVPGCYEDLDTADVLVLVGSNAAWCHPILFRRMVRARQERGARIVTIDVRGTATTESADLALTIRPGTDAVLFCGLLVDLDAKGAIDRAYVASHTEGFEPALSQARNIAPDLITVAAKCGLEVAEVAAFFDLWRNTERVVTLYSQGVNQSWQGTDKVASILACHISTGRIGTIGTGPFSLTGQPNAMGGREVGGLANQLAAHMGFTPEDRDRVGRFWNSPQVAEREGLDAVAMFDSIARGDIKALWVMGTNPAVTLPRADMVRGALARLELLVVSENVGSTDTMSSGAHVLLPALAWGEKDGTVTNSERRISRQRAFTTAPGEAMPDWWAMSQVARRMGFGAYFDHSGPAAIFREHAALSAFENGGARDFDLGGLAEISDADYDALAPIQWPVPANQSGGRARMFGDGRYFTPSSRARFKPVAEPTLAEAPSVEFPLILNTGRLRDQWHTMMRTGLSPKLSSHAAEPFVAVNSADAFRWKLEDNGFARVSTAHGTIVLKVAVTASQPLGRIFVPMHWNDETSGGARVGALVHSFTDPLSKQPDSKSTPARIESVSFRARGFILARERFALPGDSIWAWRAIEQGGYIARVATNESIAHLLDAIGFAAAAATTATYIDRSREIYRAAFITNDRLDAALLLGQHDDELSWHGFVGAWGMQQLDNSTRRFLLAGRDLPTDVDMSPTVCACFGVTSRAIQAAIDDGAFSTDSIGAELRAGTNCGSCIPELKRMIAAGLLARERGNPVPASPVQAGIA
jgi:assimilatory nitrate reductase catalytic subunit